MVSGCRDKDRAAVDSWLWSTWGMVSLASVLWQGNKSPSNSDWSWQSALIFSSSVLGLGGRGGSGLGSLLIPSQKCQVPVLILGWAGGSSSRVVHSLVLVACGDLSFSLSLSAERSRPGSFSPRSSEPVEQGRGCNAFGPSFWKRSTVTLATLYSLETSCKFNPRSRAGELSFTFSRGECRRIWEQIVKPTHCPVCSKKGEWG